MDKKQLEDIYGLLSKIRKKISGERSGSFNVGEAFDKLVRVVSIELKEIVWQEYLEKLRAER